MSKCSHPLAIILLSVALCASAASVRAQDIVESAGITSIRVINANAGDIEIAFDIPVCADKPSAPNIAVLEKTRSSNFEAMASVLMAALLGKLQVRTQTGGPTCTLQYIWIPRP